ncbi:hypothetical protein VNO80_08838 [Phaseolus coccineus]|uniref:Uncharacterized protein n=1 Tax=Phaseolus coccineus TaxID=3886 RepID=A0AAN9N530_PHACN
MKQWKQGGAAKKLTLPTNPDYSRSSKNLALYMCTELGIDLTVLIIGQDMNDIRCKLMNILPTANLLPIPEEIKPPTILSHYKNLYYHKGNVENMLNEQMSTQVIKSNE